MREWVESNPEAAQHLIDEVVVDENAMDTSGAPASSELAAETTETEANGGLPALGSNLVVEHNRVAKSPVCVLVNPHFTQVSSRGNTCPTDPRRP